MTKAPRKPRVIHLDQTPLANPEEKPTEQEKIPISPGRKPRAQKNLAQLVPISDDAAQEPACGSTKTVIDALTSAPTRPVIKRFSFVKILLISLAGLISLGFGLTIDQLIRSLFERNTGLGWAAAIMTLLVVLAALGIFVREFAGFRRMRTIETMREKAKELLEGEDKGGAGQLVDQLMDIYQSRPDTARGRAKMQAHHGEIIDGADLIKLAERDLLAPLDRKSRQLVMNAAKRVSIVTAVSPRAIVDIAYVVVENMRLIRQLSELYGGRPGTIGMMKLSKNVITHLAVTGSIAIGDGIIQQFIGQGLAARLSSRLGEGVINGLLTARVGISAIDLCRPLPFTTQQRPSIGEFISDLVSLSGEDRKN